MKVDCCIGIVFISAVMYSVNESIDRALCIDNIILTSIFDKINISYLCYIYISSSDIRGSSIKKYEGKTTVKIF